MKTLRLFILAAALLGGCSPSPPPVPPAEELPLPLPLATPRAPAPAPVVRPTTLVKTGAPDQRARWKAAQIDPRRTIELDKLMARYQRTAAPYERVARMRANGVPAAIAFCLFYRESDNDFTRSPAQGDRLSSYSVNVPKARIPGKKPPFAWEDAAFDAYYVVDHLDRTNWREGQSALDKIESFNGFGYRSHGVPAPYLWAGTSLYGVPGAPRGKYVRDGVFDSTATDKQLGVAAILLRMKQRRIAVSFD